MLQHGQEETVVLDILNAPAAPHLMTGRADVLRPAHTYTTNITYGRQINLKFDLSSMPTISDASLKRHRVSASSGIEYRVGVFASSNTSWTETGLAWSNRPLTYASSNSSRNPFAEPRYKTATGVSLSGGRVVISATDPEVLVWLPIGTNNRAYYSNDGGDVWVCDDGDYNGNSGLT